MSQVSPMVVLQTPTQFISRFVLRMLGWRIVGTFPDFAKYVVIGAPHTTNWDFFYMLLLKGATRTNLKWVGKDSLFRQPIGGIMRWLGGIPVNRRASQKFVDQVVALYNENENLIIAISPEGTRSKTNVWKSGFYYMAFGAGVPIVLVAIDYAHKMLEIGPAIVPSGEIRTDFEIIQRFYTNRIGKHPERQGRVELRPDDDQKLD